MKFASLALILICNLSFAAFEEVRSPGVAKAILEFPTYSFYLGAPNVNGVAYVPNFAPRLGAQVEWKELGATFTVALPLPSSEIERRGSTDQFNLVFNKYWRHTALDVYTQHYRGFYVSNPLTELNVNRPSRYPQLPDAEITNVGANFYQVVDEDNYSLAAAFGQTEIQSDDGGSLIYTGFYNHLEMSMGSRFIPGSDSNAPLQSLPNLEHGIFDTLGAGAGYGYTWVHSSFSFTLQAIFGLAIQRQRIDRLGDSEETHYSPALKGNLNAALGYQKDDHLFGVKFLADSLTSNVRSVQVYSTLINGLCYWGLRF